MVNVRLKNQLYKYCLVLNNCTSKFIEGFKMSKKRQLDSNDDESGDSKKARNNNKKHWSLGLLDAMHNPNLLIKSDTKAVVIKDKYPKAKYHYLVLPKANISNLNNLTRQHAKLLKHMEKLGKSVIDDEEHKKYTFKFGYHAEASMQRLHLHVISDDMNSQCVKTKKHWNSFTTNFFLDAKTVRKELKETDKITLPTDAQIKEYLNIPIACHKCNYKGKHMPDLKKHILVHL